MDMENFDPLEEWVVRITACRASRQTAVAWCAANNLKIDQYKYWLQKLKNLNLVAATPTAAKSAATPSRWVPIEVDVLDEVNSQKTLLIKVGCATIEICSGFDPKLLASVVRALSLSC